MTFDEAKAFLQSYFSSDELDDDEIRRQDEHWEGVAGDAVRFPHADLDFIDKFGEAATTYLALQHGTIKRPWTTPAHRRIEQPIETFEPEKEG